MHYYRIFLALLTFMVTAVFSRAESPFTFELRHNQRGKILNNYWVLRGTRAARLQSLILNYVPNRIASDYHLKGLVRWEDKGLWNVNAYRISPGKYKVWFSRRGARDWFQYWTIPQMRIPATGPWFYITHLSLTRQFPLGKLEGRVRFNASTGAAALHWATVQPKR